MLLPHAQGAKRCLSDLMHNAEATHRRGTGRITAGDQLPAQLLALQHRNFSGKQIILL
ncbi:MULTISPECIES: hypothetical protein [Pantoea]|jgi:hypothetical protein|uniref:hypothetical protein n=1 Tax=unclassified Pantoea TaxID=2630326 RepID=UPI0002D7D7E3|nr:MULTISPECIES: hypothetical protein [Pantoea]KAJ9430082.1 hypothetical protein PMI39_021150 [Pantoea sp. YR343]MRT25737.1 hypothetical protein [Enterobacteriaceae bacterium RIT697]